MTHQEEIDLSLSCQHSEMGSCIIPCPWCGIYGFYSPKITPNKIARACKWCGIWQNEAGETYRCIFLWCTKCYNTDYTKDNLNKPCEQCGIKMVQVKWPIDGLLELNYLHREIKKEVYMIHQYQTYGHKISKEFIDLILD